MRLTALILLTSLVASSAAGDFILQQPIACTLGEDCYIQQFVDHDPTSAASDFACGTLTYDGHKGTDFALPSLAAQAAGVNVIAAAAGRVMGVRNEMPDILQGTSGAPNVSDRECGNGLVVKHDDGWETQYCHLARGSVTVTTGQIIAAGDILGQVGLSGQTQFPHVHLSVRHNGAVVDPFDADENVNCANPGDTSLWQTPLPTPAGGVVNIGFADALPDYADAKAGIANATDLTATAPALVVWALGFGSQPGDVMTLTIHGPTGTVVTDKVMLSRQQAQFFRTVGRRMPSGGWPTGDYTAVVHLQRGDIDLGQRSATITLN